MIFSTINQLNCFLIFLVFGFLCAIIYNLFFIIFCINFSKDFKKIIFQSIIFSTFSIFFVFLLNYFNFGKISIALFLAFVVGFFWFNKLAKNLVVFLSLKWYTILKSSKRKNTTNESKL